MQHKDVDSHSKVAVGHKQAERAEESDKTEKPVTRGERDKAEHEDPIVELKDMPD
jgi:hypothetical protein